MVIFNLWSYVTNFPVFLVLLDDRRWVTSSGYGVISIVSPVAFAGSPPRSIIIHDERKVVVFHRWDKGGLFFHDVQDGYAVGFPAAGTWRLRFNSDSQGYDDDFKNNPSTDDVIAEAGVYDGLPWYAMVSIVPYLSADLFARSLPVCSVAVVASIGGL